MLDPDTKDLFVGTRNKTEFIATTKASKNDDGILEVEIAGG